MSNGHLAYVQPLPNGKMEVELPRAFKVVRSDGNTEIVWAHSFSPMEGDLVFSQYKLKDIRTIGAEGKIVTTPMALQTFHRIIAAGTWTDVYEEVVPSPRNTSVN